MQELKLAMDENYPTENNTDGVDAKGRRWMTVEELEDYAELTKSVTPSLFVKRMNDFRRIPLSGPFSGGTLSSVFC